MCVIMKYTKDSGFPKEETLKSAEMLNKDGGGIAWIDNGKVKWEKGMRGEIDRKTALQLFIGIMMLL